MANLILQKTDKKENPPQKKPNRFKRFVRNAVITGTILTLPFSMSAQSQKSEFSMLRVFDNDTTKMISELTRLYRQTAADNSEKSVILEYFFNKKFYIQEKPTEALELNENIVLSVSNQVYLKKHSIIHSKYYAVFYVESMGREGDILVCRKKSR